MPNEPRKDVHKCTLGYQKMSLYSTHVKIGAFA